MTQSVLIRVSGPWADAAAISLAVAKTNQGYVVSQGALQHAIRSTKLPLSTITDTQTIAQVQGPAGSVDALLETVSAVNCLLDAGGQSVHIDACDRTHSEQQWRDLSLRTDESRLLDVFVNFGGSSDENCSFGMHTLGLRDVVVDDETEREYAVILMKAFLYYVYLDDPAPSGHATFRTGPHDPVYQQLPVPCATFNSDDPRFNPIGMWQLRRI